MSFDVNIYMACFTKKVISTVSWIFIAVVTLADKIDLLNLFEDCTHL